MMKKIFYQNQLRQCRLNFYSVTINFLSRRSLRKKKTCPTESLKSLKVNEMKKARCIISSSGLNGLSKLCFGWLSEDPYMIMTQQFSLESTPHRARCSLRWGQRSPKKLR